MESRVMSIAHGPQGTRETLVMMAALAHEAQSSETFRAFARWIKSVAEINALRRFYVYTPEEVETLYAPEINLRHFIEHGSLIGDCDDISTFLAAIFLFHRVPSRFVAMRTKRNDPDFYHVVVEAFLGDNWKRFDLTVPPAMQQIDYGQMIEYV